MKPLLSNHRYTIIAGLLTAASYVYLAVNSREYGQVTLVDLWLVCGFSAMLSFAVWQYNGVQNKQVPVILLLGFALLFRLIALWAHPLLEDDFYRYLWDGYVLAEQGTPYGIAPAEFFGDDTVPSLFSDILDRINYPYLATVYGPVCQWLFTLAYWIDPGEIWPLKAIIVLADMLLIGLLLRLASINNVLLYAWCPLIITEYAFTAHPDVVGALFMVAALLACKHQYWYRAAAFIALAAGVKVFALVITPFLLRFRWRAWLVFLLIAGAVSSPFGLLPAWWPEGLSTMADSWLFNAPLYTLLLHYLPAVWIKLGLLCLFAAFCLLLFVKSAPDTQPRGDWLYGAFFLLTPVLNPWYLVWLLPFAVIYPSRWAWTASVSLLLAYASGINLSNSSLALYQHPALVLIVEFTVIGIALIWDVRTGRLQQQTFS